MIIDRDLLPVEDSMPRDRHEPLPSSILQLFFHLFSQQRAACRLFPSSKKDRVQSAQSRELADGRRGDLTSRKIVQFISRSPQVSRPATYNFLHG